MAFPYQCLVARESTETGPGGWTLFGACGPTLVAQSSSGGTSTWTKPDEPVTVSLAVFTVPLSQDVVAGLH